MPDEAVEEEPSTDCTELGDPAMRWYRKSIFLQHHPVEAAADTVQSYLFQQTDAGGEES